MNYSSTFFFFWIALLSSSVVIYSCRQNKTEVSIKQNQIALIIPKSSSNNSIWGKPTYSNNGKLIASGLSDNTIIIYEAETGLELKQLIGHNESIEKLMFSSNDELLLTSAGQTSKIWNVESGKQLISFNGAEASFSPDSRNVITIVNGVTTSWETATGKAVLILSKHQNVVSANFNNEGNLLASVSNETVKIWDSTNGELKTEIEYPGEFYKFKFSPNGKIIVTTGFDSFANVFDIKTGKLKFQLKGHSADIKNVSFNTDGSKIITCSSDKTAKIWDAYTGQLIRTFDGHKEDVTFAELNSEEKQLITTSYDNTCKVWDVMTGAVIKSLLFRPTIKFNAGITDAYLRPNINELIITCGDVGVSGVWNIKTDSLKFELTHDISESPGSVAITRDKKYVISNFGVSFLETGVRSISRTDQLKNYIGCSNDYLKFITADSTGKIRIINSTSLEPIINFKEKEFLDIKLGNDGENILTTSGYQNSVVKIRNITNGKSSLEIFTKNNGLNSLFRTQISEKKGIVVVPFDDQRLLRIYKVGEAKPTSEIKGEFDFTRLSPDGKTLATCSFSGEKGNLFQLWDCESGNEQMKLVGHESIIRDAIFSQDSRNIFTASDDRTIKQWEVKDGSLIRTFLGHSNRIKTIKLSQNQKNIVTSSYDNSVRIWDIKNGNPINIYLDQIGIQDAYFSQDESILIGIFPDKFRLWDLKNDRELFSFITLKGNNWILAHPSGLFDASQGAMDKLYFVQGLDIIDFAQLKERYYEPGLWKKVMSGEKLREVAAFKSIELPPDIEQDQDDDFGVANLTFKNREGGIGPISITVNGLEVMEDIRPSGFNSKKKSWSYELKLSSLPNLKKGEENLIEVRAWNEGHWVISRPLQIKFTPASTRGAVAEVEESKEKKPIPNIHILTCGVSDYTGNAIDLKYATKDAESMAKALQLGANKLVGTGKTFVYSLTDNSTLKPTKANIKKTFAEISKKSSPNDVFVVYLSGHGINWGGDNGDFYYLTSDAYSTELQAYNDPAIRTNATISSKELIELFKTVPSDKRVLMIDACASGKMVQNLVSSRDISSSTLRALDRLRDRTGFHIITGCAADAVSYEASRFGQGVLTYSLIEGIKGSNKFVDINTLFQHAKERVPDLAKGIGGIQSPQVFSPQGCQSFDIGELDDEIKKQIPLPKTRPVFVRSTFINDQTLDDTDDLETSLDEALNELSSKGEKASILFMDIQKYDEGCKISGKYKKANGLITATYKIKCDGKEQIKTAVGKTAKEVAEKIVGEIDR